MHTKIRTNDTCCHSRDPNTLVLSALSTVLTQSHGLNRDKHIWGPFSSCISRSSIASIAKQDFSQPCQSPNPRTYTVVYPSMMTVKPQDSRPRPSRQRSGTACIDCRRRKLRCDGIEPQCGACRDSGLECTATQHVAPRGPKKGHIRNLQTRLGELGTLREDIRIR